MDKDNIKKQFEERILPLEIEAKEEFEYFLRESPNEKANKVIKWIRDDEIRHIELCKKVIEILKK